MRIKIKEEKGFTFWINFLCILLLFAILSGCAPKITVVDQEGKPVVNYAIETRSPGEQGLNCSFYVLKEKQAGKYAVAREYLDIMEDYKFKSLKETKITIFLHIVNPKSLEYSLFYTHEYNATQTVELSDEKTQVETKGGIIMSLKMFKQLFPKEKPTPINQMTREGQIIPKRIDDQVYKGNDPDKEFTIVAPDSPGDHRILLTIFRGGRIQAIFGDFHYTVD